MAKNVRYKLNSSMKPYDVTKPVIPFTCLLADQIHINSLTNNVTLFHRLDSQMDSWTVPHTKASFIIQNLTFECTNLSILAIYTW